MTIETKELVISEELKRKINMICRFASVNYELINGSVISLKNTNIAYAKPHILKVNVDDTFDKVLKICYYEYVKETCIK